MPTQEEILLTILGKDEASPVFGQVSANAQSAFSNVKSAADDGASGLADSYMSAISGISSAFSQLNVGMMSLNSVSHQVMGTLGAAKSASDLVFGTSSKAETNKVLVKGWGDAKVSAEELYDTVDQVTDKSLTSMQDLIPAMNAFRAATGATGTELKESVAENMAQFGAYVLSLTGSEALAHTAMSDLSKGIKGRWASLDQYGVSEDALKMTGKWSGDEDDIKGYMEAVREVSGAVEELMNTSQGADALLGKMWSRAGKRLGNEYLPGITSIKRAFMDLDTEMEGNLSTSILAVSLAIEQLSGAAYKVSTLINGFRDISKVVYTAGQYLGFFGSVMSASEEAQYYAAMATQQNTQEIDNNTYARYDNIDAMYQQADAMAMLNDTTLVNDGVMETSAMAQSLGMNVPDAINAKQRSNAEQLAAGGIGGGSLGAMISQAKDDVADAEQLGLGDVVLRRKALIGEFGNEMIESESELNRFTDLLSSSIASRSLDFDSDAYGFVNQITNTFNLKDGEFKLANEAVEGAREPLIHLTENLSYHNDEIDKISSVMTEMVNVNHGVPHGDEIYESLRSKLTFHNKAKEELIGIGFEGGGKGYFDKYGEYISNLLKDSNMVDMKKVESDIESNMTLTRAIRNKFDAWGETLGETFGKITSIPGKVSSKLPNKQSFKNIRKNLSDAIDSFDIKDTLNNLDKKLYNPFRDMSKIDVPDIDIDKKVQPVVKSGEKLAETGMMAGAVAPEMAEASAGLSFMGLAEMGLAGAFTTLIVPTLAIAAVIAILIPIIAGLTIEALFFLKIIQQFFVSMNFGSVDMEGSIEGIKQLATGLGYVALAMGALLAVNIVTTIMMPFIAIANIFGGSGLTGALDLAVTSLKQAAEKIEEFSNIQINEDIAGNLENLGTALSGISKAMLGLAGIQITTGITGFLENVFQLGSVTEALESAKNDIIEASGKLQDFADITPIDEETANKIQNVCDTLGSVGDAFSGLQKIRDSQNFDILGGIANLFGGVDIKKALEDSHQTIVEASQVLQGFGDVEPIDEGIAENIKNVSTSLSSIGEAITALQSLRDTFNGGNLEGGKQGLSVPKVNVLGFDVGGFDLFTTQIPSVLESLSKVKSIIITASKGLKSFSDMPDLTELKIGDKITAFVEVLNGISTAADSMKQVRNISKGGGKFEEIPEQIATVRRSIITVGKGLVMFQDIPNLADLGISTKIKSVTDVLGKVTNAVNSMKGVHGLAKGADFSKITEDIAKARRAIITVSQGLKGMADDPNFSSVDEGLSTKIQSVSNAVKTLKTATKRFTNFPLINPEDVKTKTDNAVKAVKNAATNLKKIGGGDKVGNAVTSAINSVNKGVKKLKTVSKSFNKLPKVNSETVKTKVKNAVDAVKKTSTELKNLSSGDKVSGINGILSNIRKAISSLRKTLKESTNFKSEGKSIGSSLKSGVKNGLNGLNGVVTGAVTTAGERGKAFAGTYGTGMGSRMKTNFQKAFDISTVVQNEMTEVSNAISGASPGIVSAIGQLAADMVTSFKNNAETNSPGAIARTVKAEMNYSTGFVRTHGQNTISAVGNMARRMTRIFNPNLAQNLNPNQVMNRVNSLRNINRGSELGKTQRPVNINIGAGAVQLDARNMTTKESRQIMINALEGLDAVSGIQISRG